MQITVLTPDREVFQGSIASVKVPGALGEFMVLNNHAPIVSSLTPGRVEIVAGPGEYRFYADGSNEQRTETQSGRKFVFTIDGGFIEVLNNKISLLVQGVRNIR